LNAFAIWLDIELVIEEANLRDREVWAGMARRWYDKAAEKSPNVGRIQDHLAVSARPRIVQQLFYYSEALVDRLETILPYVVSPWNERIELQKDSEDERQQSRVSETLTSSGAVIVMAFAEKKGLLGHGGAILTAAGLPTHFIGYCGARSEQNPYTAELTTAAKALEFFPEAVERVTTWKDNTEALDNLTTLSVNQN
jgi:hypothetical protein